MAVLVATGTAAVALSWFIAQHSLIGARWTFILLVAVWVPLWVAGAWAAGRIPSHKWAIAAIIVIAAAVRLTAATGTTPPISNDLYRYGWDAHVQLSGVDPYRYPPDAPELVRLRTATYFPNHSECVHLRAGTGPSCTTINRPEARTIYPPVAEAWFDAVALVDPGHGIRKWQLAGGLVDLATVGLLAFGLRQLRRDPREVAWYALSPLPVIEFAGNGHVDGLGLLLLVAAFLALRRERKLLAGVLIGMATMVKLYPGIALLAGWRQGRWRMLAGAACVSVLAYAPHVVAVGGRIVGYLPGYLREEHYSSGGRFLILGLLPVSGHSLAALAAITVVVAAFLVLRSGVQPHVAAATILAVVLLVASPVQPWYGVVLAGLGVLAGAPWLTLPALLAEPYYAAVILNSRHQIGIGQLCYGAAAFVLLIALLIRQRAAQRVRIGAMSSTRL
jgi:glycosyl transferase family 87